MAIMELDYVISFNNIYKHYFEKTKISKLPLELIKIIPLFLYNVCVDCKQYIKTDYACNCGKIRYKYCNHCNTYLSDIACGNITCCTSIISDFVCIILGCENK